jgi:hypothetical protein
MSALIDRFIPRSETRERHATVVAAPADLVFDVARDMDLRSIPVIGAIFWLREKVFRSKPAPRQPQGLVAETLALGWGELAFRPQRELVMGAVTQPWRADVVLTAVPPEQFAAFDEPDLVKIAWTLEAEPIDATHSRYASETRVVSTSEWARRKFRRYWRLVGVGIVLIRRLALSAVRREAERRFRDRDRQGPGRPPSVSRPGSA